MPSDPANPSEPHGTRSREGDSTSRPWRVALFVGAFPVVSETFILRQIAGLMDQGHDVDVFADVRTEPVSVGHAEWTDYRLMDRTTFMEMPPESAPWELPARPPWGRSWIPGQSESTSNLLRWTRALPHLGRCLVRAPRLTWEVLRVACYGYQAESLSALYRLSTLSRVEGPYDVLHAHFGPVASSFRFARRLFHAPLVATFHGYDLTTVPRERGRQVYDPLWQVADAVTVNSSFAGERLLALGCPPERLHRLPMGVDPDRFPFRARKKGQGEPVRLLTVARLVPIKGHAVAIDAVRQLRVEGLNVTYDIVGEGSLVGPLRRQVAEAGLEDWIRIHPACHGEELRAWLERCDLFVLPSRSVSGDEEAQASGMPVVAARSGGIPEGLDPGRSGLLFDQSDAKGLAACLRELAAHPERWEAMGRAGRDFVSRHFNLRDLNARWVEIYARARENYSA